MGLRVNGSGFDSGYLVQEGSSVGVRVYGARCARARQEMSSARLGLPVRRRWGSWCSVLGSEFIFYEKSQSSGRPTLWWQGAGLQGRVWDGAGVACASVLGVVGQGVEYRL